jgi:hypothetical protein
MNGHAMTMLSLRATLEFLLTEHTYLTSLRLLLVQDGTRTAAPPLMVHHAWALVRASEAFLWRVEELVSKAETEGTDVADESDGNTEHISVTLVAQAFINVHRRIQKAMVDWSRVVGGFFIGQDEKAAPSPASVSAILERMKVKTKDTLPTNQKKYWRTGTSEPTSPSISVCRVKDSHVRSKSGDLEMQRSDFKSKPGVRELAILPTQRVMRYVLLFEGKVHMLICARKQRLPVKPVRSASVPVSRITIPHVGQAGTRSCPDYGFEMR